MSSNRELIRKAFPAFRTNFMARYVPKGASGEVSRVAGRFAIVAFAGEMARGWEIVPWPRGEAEAAAGRCFQDWLATRTTLGASDIDRAIAQVRQFIEVQGAARFAELADGRIARSTYAAQAGYRRTENGVQEFLVLNDVFRSELCKGFDHVAVARELVTRGHLLKGSEKDKYTTKVTVDGLRKPVYRILASLLEDM